MYIEVVICLCFFILFVHILHNYYSKKVLTETFDNNIKETEFHQVINTKIKNLILGLNLKDKKINTITYQQHYIIICKLINTIFNWWEKVPKQLRQQINILQYYNIKNKQIYKDLIIEKLMSEVPFFYELNNENIQKYYSNIDEAFVDVGNSQLFDKDDESD